MVSTKHESFSQMFSTFFNNSKMASTYKPVFLRALLDIGDMDESKQHNKIIGGQWLCIDGPKLFIDLNFIAVRFAKYYWDMEYSFHLRQTQVKTDDARIIQSIKAEHDSNKKPPTTRDIADKKMEKFRKLVISDSLQPEVLKHLKTDMPDLYKLDGNTIIVDVDLIHFLNVHKTTLKYGLNYVLSKYLEKINPYIPRIATKVNNNPNYHTRQILHKEIKDKMEILQDHVCFYCKRKIPKYHVDHVIPFNFVFSTDPHNCVLACPQCNCAKSNMLPEERLFSRVLDRNDNIKSIFGNRKSIYNESKYSHLYDTCSTEYNGDNFFNPNL